MDKLFTAVPLMSDAALDGIVSDLALGDKPVILCNNRLLYLDGDYNVSEFYSPDNGKRIAAISITGDNLYSFETDGISTYYIEVNKSDAQAVVLEDNKIAYKAVAYEDNIVAAYNDGLSVYDLDGQKLFTQATRGLAADIITANGKIFVLIQTGASPVLYHLDIERKSLMEITALPSFTITSAIYCGNDTYDLLFQSDADIYGVKINSRECVLIADMMQSDIDPVSITLIASVNSGSFVCFVADSSNISRIYELTDSSIVQNDEQVLTLALFNNDLSGDLMVSVSEWNRANPGYRIEIVKYSSDTGLYQYTGSNSFGNGYDKFILDITAGKIPDIIDVSILPVENLSRKGLFEDLYDYIDRDSELSRNDFYSGVLKAAEIDGHLYHTLSGFMLVTAYGKANIVDGISEMGFAEVVGAFEKSGMRSFYSVSARNFLMSLFSPVFANEFIDWDTGVCNFDTAMFAQYLTILQKFPANDIDGNSNAGLSECFLTQSYIDNVQLFSSENPIWQSDAAITGIPTMGGARNFIIGSGPQLAISSACSDKDKAWDFVRTLFAEEYQRNRYTVRLMSNKNAEQTIFTKTLNFRTDDEKKLYQNRYDKITDILDSDDLKFIRTDHSLYDIIVEEALAYLAGSKTAEDTAAVIQSRVSMYVAERR
ncbi:MAG: extracellular solute-binding protein [Oscillospiraceae bacterium]|nr:extracellular solute-binding protein [Oscillospiraceae bacterium]